MCFFVFELGQGTGRTATLTTQARSEGRQETSPPETMFASGVESTLEKNFVCFDPRVSLLSITAPEYGQI